MDEMGGISKDILLYSPGVSISFALAVLCLFVSDIRKSLSLAGNPLTLTF